MHRHRINEHKYYTHTNGMDMDSNTVTHRIALPARLSSRTSQGSRVKGGAWCVVRGRREAKLTRGARRATMKTNALRGKRQRAHFADNVSQRKLMYAAIAIGRDWEQFRFCGLALAGTGTPHCGYSSLAGFDRVLLCSTGTELTDPSAMMYAKIFEWV